MFILDATEISMAEDRPDPPSGGFWIDTGMPSQDEMIGYLNWLMGSFLLIFQGDIRACLPTGVVVRPDNCLTWFEDVGSQHSDLLNFPAGYDGRCRLKARVFYGIDANHGWVVADNFPKGLRNLYTGADETPIFGPLIGSPLCIRQAQLPTALSLLSDWLSKEIAKRVSNGDDEWGGESNALRCLKEAFPDGKGNHTWEDVQNRTGYSRRTILRALKAAGMMAWLRT